MHMGDSTLHRLAHYTVDTDMSKAICAGNYAYLMPLGTCMYTQGQSAKAILTTVTYGVTIALRTNEDTYI